jgi:hypothetical protein
MNPSCSRLAILCLVPSIVALMPSESRAWGAEGHMIVALVADRLLQAGDAAAHKKLVELLATDKSNTWTKTDIAGEATWADVLLAKSPEGRVATTLWHYVTLDAANPDVRDDCVVDKIEQFAKELRDPATLPGERLTALQFLLNFVAEVNDPLLTIEQHDQGGHCVAVMPPATKTPVRLSAYWENTLVVDAVGKDPAKAAAEIVAGLTPADIEKWSGSSPADWALESYKVAKEVTYSFAKDKSKGSVSKYSFPVHKGAKDSCGAVPLYRVDAGYHDRAVAAVREQLAKGGVRLASLLRENLR